VQFGDEEPDLDDPFPPFDGRLFYNEETDQLKIYDDGWKAVGGEGGFLPLTGGTLTGSLAIIGAQGRNAELGAAYLVQDGPVGSQYITRVNGTNRWQLIFNATSGQIVAYPDAGGVSYPLSVDRNSGVVTFSAGDIRVQQSNFSQIVVTDQRSSFSSAVLSANSGSSSQLVLSAPTNYANQIVLRWSNQITWTLGQQTADFSLARYAGGVYADSPIIARNNGNVEIPNLQGYLPLSGGTLTGQLNVNAPQGITTTGQITATQTVSFLARRSDAPTWGTDISAGLLSLYSSSGNAQLRFGETQGTFRWSMGGAYNTATTPFVIHNQSLASSAISIAAATNLVTIPSLQVTNTPTQPNDAVRLVDLVDLHPTPPGRVTIFTVPGLYQWAADGQTQVLLVKVKGGGGGGGGSVGNSSAAVSAGGGGGEGGYAERIYFRETDLPTGTVAITVGDKGTGGTGAIPGVSGGQSYFVGPSGQYACWANGGGSGAGGDATSIYSYPEGGPGGVAALTTTWLSQQGQSGQPGLAFMRPSVGGGSVSFLKAGDGGGGARGAMIGAGGGSNRVGQPAASPGGGGSGALWGDPTTSGTNAGGDGMAGYVIIYEWF
jgi:hypothetical protein